MTLETIAVFNPGIETEQAVSTLNNLLKEITSSVVNEVWGVKKLAYPIKTHEHGLYINVLYQVSETLPREKIDEILDSNSDIIKHLTVRHEDDKWNEVHESDMIHIRDYEHSCEQPPKPDALDVLLGLASY